MRSSDLPDLKTRLPVYASGMANSNSLATGMKPAPGNISRYTTSEGAQIYRISLQAFPGLVGNVYLVVFNEYRVLIDTGSGFGDYPCP